MKSDVEIPEISILHQNHKEYDYTDSYTGVIKDFKNKIGIIDVGEMFVKPGPKWFEGLFALRNKIASMFKLKTPGETHVRNLSGNHKWEIGEEAGIFKIYDMTANEIILGEDDKHLNFRVSLLLRENSDNRSEKLITVTTVVEFNNSLGRFYFLIVKPFHKLIVPVLIQRDIRKLETEVNQNNSDL